MDVPDLILADYAAANQGGKFTLVGAGITVIHTKKVPCIHPLMFLLVRLKVTRQDVGKNKVEIRFIGEKGIIFKADADLNVSEKHLDESCVAFPMQLVNMKFELAGDYSIEVRVNGELKQSQNLKINILAPQPTKES